MLKGKSLGRQGGREEGIRLRASEKVGKGRDCAMRWWAKETKQAHEKYG